MRRIIRYCTVSMATAPSRIHCGSRSACGRIAAGNRVRYERLRDKESLDCSIFFLETFLRRRVCARGLKDAQRILQVVKRRNARNTFRRAQKSDGFVPVFFGAIRASRPSMIRRLATARARRKVVLPWKKKWGTIVEIGKAALMPAHS